MGYYSFNRSRRDGRLSWPCWLTDIGRLTHKVVTRPAISLSQDRESSPARTGGLTTMLRHQLKGRKSRSKAKSRSGVLGEGQRAPPAGFGAEPRRRGGDFQHPGCLLLSPNTVGARRNFFVVAKPLHYFSYIFSPTLYSIIFQLFVII